MNNRLPLNRPQNVRWYVWWMAAEAAGLAVRVRTLLSGRPVTAKTNSQGEAPIQSDGLIDSSLATGHSPLLLRPLALAALAAYVLGIGMGLALRIVAL